MTLTSTIMLSLLTGAAMAETINFDNDKAGSLPFPLRGGREVTAPYVRFHNPSHSGLPASPPVSRRRAWCKDRNTP